MKNKKRNINRKVIYLLEKNKCVVSSYHFNMQIYYKLILDDLSINSYEELIYNLKNNKDFKKVLNTATRNYFNNDNIKVLSNKDYTKWYFLELKDVSTLEYNIRRLFHNIKKRLNNRYLLKNAVN